MSGKVKAFKHFGVTLGNDRWSWSGRTEDGAKVVITVWTDEMNHGTKPPSCNFFGHLRLDQWTNLPGNRERIENLMWARDNCDGRLHVVMAKAKDANVVPREIDEAYPTKIVMRLLKLDENTGEFSAEVFPDA